MVIGGKVGKGGSSGSLVERQLEAKVGVDG
jgi:hypothetical protein